MECDQRECVQCMVMSSLNDLPTYPLSSTEVRGIENNN